MLLEGNNEGLIAPDLSLKSDISNADENRLKNSLEGEKTAIIKELIDTFEEVTGEKLLEKDKKELKEILKEKDKKFMINLVSIIKKSGKSITLNKLKYILNIRKANKTTEKEKKTTEKEEKDIDKVYENSERVNEDRRRVNEDSERVNEDRRKVSEKIIELKDMITSLGLSKNNPSYGFVVDFLNNIKSGEKVNEHKINQIINRLKSSPKILRELSLDIRKKGPKEYENFKQIMIHFDSSFELIFPQIENQNIEDMMNLGISDPGALNLDNKNIYTINGDTKITLEKDSDNKVSRKIGLIGSDYTLKKQIGKESNKRLKEIRTQIFQENNRFSLEIQKIDSKIQNLKVLQNYLQNAKDFIGTLPPEEKKKRFTELNLFLKQKYSNDFGEIKDKEALENKIYLTKNHLEKLKTEKEQKTVIHKEKMDRLLNINKLIVGELDIEMKKTLNFLHKIGFDLIPKKVTDKIIESLNRSPMMLAKYGFNNPIDIINGDLGFDKDGNKSSITLQEKILFSQFVNKMITGDKNFPYKFNSSGEVEFFTIEDKKIGIFVNKESYIKEKLGINPFETIINNLKSTQKEPSKEKS